MTEASEHLHQLVMDLVRAAGLVQGDQLLHGARVSLSQIFALHELDTDRPLSQRELAERLNLEKSTVSRMVAEMERQGLVVRERDPDNRRFYRLRLTPDGQARHRSAGSGMHAHFVRAVAAMNDTERAALMVGLPALVRELRADTRRAIPTDTA